MDPVRFEPIEPPENIPEVWAAALVPGPETDYFSAGREWYEREAADLFTVRVAVFGDGSQKTPFMVAVWVPPVTFTDFDGPDLERPGRWATEQTEGRYPTFIELWDALDLTLEGALFAAPMYMAGVERPDAALPPGVYGALVVYRQVSAREGSPARARYDMSGTGGLIIEA